MDNRSAQLPSPLGRSAYRFTRDAPSRNAKTGVKEKIM
jgi:hypothetical protein